MVTKHPKIPHHADYRKHLWDQIASDVLLMQSHLKRFPHDNPRPQDHSWLIPGKASPGSMTDEEGMIIYELIRLNGFTSGFELCTGFGYSSVFAALALRENSGKLKTLDCYVEEWKESWLYNRNELTEAITRVQAMIQQGKNPEGLALAKRFAHELKLSDSIEFHLGVSPEDVPIVIGSEKIDYVLIDGGHDGDQPLQDWLAVKPFIADRCAIVFHDSHQWATPVKKAIQATEDYLGVPAVHLNTRWALSIVGRNLNPSTLPALHALCIRNQPRPLREHLRVFATRIKKKIERLLTKVS